MNLKKLIREVLEDKSCCKATKPTKAPILNESLAPREILSEGLQYHIDNKKPLTDPVDSGSTTLILTLGTADGFTVTNLTSNLAMVLDTSTRNTLYSTCFFLNPLFHCISCSI